MLVDTQLRACSLTNYIKSNPQSITLLSDEAMTTTLRKIAGYIGRYLRETRVPNGSATKTVLEALNAAKPAIEKRYGGVIRRRHSGFPSVEAFAEDGGKGVKKPKVIEFLWDFSFSRGRITEAIGQNGYKPCADKHFRLIFVAESELGTPTEVCRDLIKLMEARAPIRCLVFLKKARIHDELLARIVKVMRRHELFEPPQEGWLFVALGQQGQRLAAEFYTLDDELSSLSVLPEIPPAPFGELITHLGLYPR